VAKHIFVTGGVASSLGKGITAASIGRLLKSQGLVVSLQKLDPYINVDPGTMNPFEHGEVFVTVDGAETDLDLGHYERFVDVPLRRASSVTTGSIYRAVIEGERRGDYLGKTVQVIPHVTDEIKRRIHQAADEETDVVITEIGGTVGDIEILPFLEALRQFRNEVPRSDVCFVHVTLVPHIGPSQEEKTKPTQHSVTELRSRGIQPDIIVARSDRQLTESVRQKISMFCDVPIQGVVAALDTDNIYEVPLMLHDEGLDGYLSDLLGLTGEPDLEDWRGMVQRARSPRYKVRVAIIGKYVDHQDAYLSVVEALRHGGYSNDAQVEIEWVSAEEVTPMMAESVFDGIDAVVIPGGFGSRGIDGKITAAQVTRELDIPCLGICLGLQTMVVDVARHVLGLTGAHSREFDPLTPYPVIDLMENQKAVTELGGTMRLGTYPARLKPGSKVAELYGQEVVYERHRHRFEVNQRFHGKLEEAGLRLSGMSPDNTLVEFIELPGHLFWVGTQAHPEFQSRPNRPHPLFAGLIEAALKRHGASLD
jgi:CTP synthase